MPRAFLVKPTAPYPVAKTYRLGAGNTTNDNFDTFSENLKFVKLAGESRMDLCEAGDAIEGYIAAVEQATQGGFTIGSVMDSGRIFVLFDGAEATPGTGTVAVGDYVVTGTVTAKGTKLASYPKVTTATDQAAAAAAPFKWRVVSLGDAGTGAVGTIGVIERV